MASSSIPSLLSFALAFLLLSHASVAKLSFVSPNECRIERLHAQEPAYRLRSEGGITEHYNPDADQLNCAGVSVTRRTIQPGGLLLPSYINAPSLSYVIRGRGMTGISMPGCPESFQVFQESRRGRFQNQQRGQVEGDSQWQVRDQHQAVNRIREGDVIAFHAGVTHWCYNDGESPLVVVTLTDTSNRHNQLDRHHREFMLAGGKRQQQEMGRGEGQEQNQGGDVDENQRDVSEILKSRSNILRGFDTEFLADALDVSRELASRLQRPNEERGEIIRVRERLQIVRPSSQRGGEYESEGEDESERESEREGEGEYESEREYSQREREYESEYGYGRMNGTMNGIEQAFCTMKVKENIGDASRADVYNPRAGRITTLNRFKLPILRSIKLSATRGALRRNAFLAPQWSANAHNIMYVIRGSCRCQVVDNRGRTVFNGEVRQGQILVIPQHYAQLKQARSDDFEWISFLTTDNEVASPLVGKKSVLKGLPEAVLMNSYGISRQDARNLKWNRGQEFAVFPQSRSRSFSREERAAA